MGVIIDELIFSYVKHNIPTFLIYFIVVVISYSIGSLFIPKIISKFIYSNMKLNNNVFNNILEKIGSKTTVGYIYIIFIFVILYSLFTYWKLVIQTDILINISGYVRVKYINKILNKLINSYKEIHETQLTYFASNIYWAAKLFVRYIFNFIIPFIFTFLLIFVYFIFNIPILALILVIQLIIIFLLLYFNFNKLIILSNDQEKKFDEYGKNYGDKVKNLLNIIFDNMISKEMKDIKKYQLTHNDTGFKLYKLADLISFLGTFVSYSLLIFASIILYNYYTKSLVTKDTITSTLFILIIYVFMLYTFFNETLAFVSQYSKIIRVEDQLNSLKDEIKCISIDSFYSIKFKNVYYSYNNEDYILKNLNMEFLPKKINVLMGKSGSGKSTIMKLIVKMYNIKYGKIYLGDNDINDICQADIREKIYYVNQRTILFDDSLINNISYGNNKNKKQIIDMLNKYDLSNYFKTLGNGVNSNCGVNGSNLSLGMQKIIMVLRGILKPNKNIIIFDEPLTSLDKKTRMKIIKLIVNETKGKTVIIISHDNEILPHAHKVIKL